MMNYTDYVTKALELFDAGFRTKSAKNDAKGYIGGAYRLLTEREITSTLLKNYTGPVDENGDETIEGWDEHIQYVRSYDMPRSVAHVREKHIAKARELSDDIADRMAFLADTYKAIKEAEVEKVEVKVDDTEKKYKKKVEESILEMMERHKTRYLEAVDLARMFNGVPVTANTHLVTNAYGTTFVRTFYYLNGKLTKLNILIAAAETVAREKKDAAK